MEYATRQAPASWRRRIFESELGLVEDYRCAGANRRRTPAGHSPDFQIGLPYDGLFVWHVGADAVVSDPNQVLFVAGGEDFHLSEPLPGPYAELIVTPRADLLAELLGTDASRLSAHPLFRQRRALAQPATQLGRTRALHGVRWTGLEGDEALLGLMRTALGAGRTPCVVTGSTRRLVDAAKQFVAARLASRLRLACVARAVGASPAYLTDAFRRIEGLSLHRYVVRLRLARALVELPHAGDITALALDLGFSSHSHFTAAFRSAFGCTPSDVRRSAAGRRRRTDGSRFVTAPCGASGSCTSHGDPRAR